MNYDVSSLYYFRLYISKLITKIIEIITLITIQLYITRIMYGYNKYIAVNINNRRSIVVVIDYFL